MDVRSRRCRVRFLAAWTAPHKGSVRRRGTYGSSAPRGLGAVAGISPFCEYLNLFVLFVCLFVCLFVLGYTMFWFLVYDAVASGTCTACAPSANCGHTP